MAAMFRRLFHRNVAALVAIVLAGQLLAGFFAMTLVIRPQVQRVASVTADMVTALSNAMAGTDPAKQADLIAAINRSGSMSVRPVAQVPSDGARFPTFVERQFMRAMAARLGAQHELVWRTDGGGQLWFKLRLGNADYWVSMTPPSRRGALASLMMSSLIAFAVSIVCGLALQRRIDEPMRRLVRTVDGYRTDGTQPPLDTSGPEEVAALAGALNRMNERLAGQEAERALMLAGVSHDLRTPLTRLRLSLEMMRGHDAELEAGAIRQVDRLEAMLGQFLDFGRGFDSEPPQSTNVAALVAAAADDAGTDDGLIVDISETLDFPLRARAVRRAVGNLLTNARRHGAAPIGVQAARDGACLRFDISDAGPGIDPAAAQSLLRPFARGDSARSGDGTGLGLAIADRVAAAHGGSVTFARIGGKFVVTLILGSDSRAG